MFGSCHLNFYYFGDRYVVQYFTKEVFVHKPMVTIYVFVKLFFLIIQGIQPTKLKCPLKPYQRPLNAHHAPVVQTLQLRVY